MSSHTYGDYQINSFRLQEHMAALFRLGILQEGYFASE